MFPVLEVLVAIILAMAYESPVVGQVPALESLGSNGLWILALQGLGAVASVVGARWSARPLARGEIGAAILRHERTFLGLRLAILGLFAAQIHLFDWPLLVRALGLRGMILIDEIAILAPFFLHLVLAWSASYGVERRFRFRRWSRTGYVFFQLRQRVLPMVPVLFLWFVFDLLNNLAAYHPLVARFRLQLSYSVPVQWAVVISAFVLIMLLAPFLFRLLWGMRSLPDGPVRRRLEAFGERVGFRTRDILYWPTRGNVLNAAIIGLVGRFRYVMITDGLLASLDEDEIEAVYAHEVGHAKYRHMPLLLLFAIALIFITHLVSTRLPLAVLDAPETVQTAGLIVLVLVWWGGLFGWVSRRFETQADVYGATATATPEGDPDASAFISALENLAEESGQIRHLRGLRHPSIAERTGFLRSYLADPDVRRRYRGAIRRLTLIFLLAFLGVAVAAMSTLPEEWRIGEARIAAADGEADRAITLCHDISPGWRRDDVLAEAVRRLAREELDEKGAIAIADRLLAFAGDNPESDQVLLLIGGMLVRAAEQIRGPDQAFRTRVHAEAAGPILGLIARADADSDRERRRGAEAAMFLGRLFVSLAGLESAGLPAADADRQRIQLFEAEGWLERAEALAPEDAPRDEADPLRLPRNILSLRADIEARTGRLDAALTTFAKSARAQGRHPGEEPPYVAWIVQRRRSAHLAPAERQALADWAWDMPSSGDARIRARIEALRTLILLAGEWAQAARMRRDHEAMDRAMETVELVGPLVGRLTDEEYPTHDLTDATRALALRERARLLRVMALLPAVEGRTADGHVLWVRDLLDRASKDDQRAAALQR